MSIALYLAGLFGLMVCAGYIGGLTARYKAPSVEKRTEPPWSAYERAILVENIGFLSGAAGGGFVLLLSFIVCWMGRLHIEL
jgi:uncharacterized membrane protein YfcA